MKKEIYFCGLLFATVSLMGNGGDGTWVTTTSGDLNTSSNWSPAAVPTEQATFDNTYTDVILSPTATAAFAVDSFYFPNSAAAFQFTFSDAGTLTFAGAGITGASNTNTTINITTSSSITVPQLAFYSDSSTSSTSMGNAAFTLTNTTGGSLSLYNAAQLVLSDSDYTYPAIPVTAGDNVRIMVSNTGTGLISGGNEAAQIFLKGASFTAGNAINVNLSNTSSMGIQGNSDTAQIGLDAAGATANFTTGDSATFVFTNGSGAQIASMSHGNNVGQIVIDGHNGESIFTVGNTSNFTFTNSASSTISTPSSGDDAGQIVLDGDNGTASFVVGDSVNITMSNLASTINGAGFDTAQIVVDGDSGIASWSSGDSTTLQMTNDGTSSIVAGSDGNDVGQIIVDGDSGTATFTFGQNAALTLSNAGSMTGYLNAGQIVVDGTASAATFTVGDNGTITATNSGTISNAASGYIVAQIAFNGTAATLAAGNNVTITAINTDDATITNTSGTAAQIYFSSAVITGTPTITAINQGSSPPGAVQGVYFDGSATGGAVNIVLQNASLAFDTGGSFSIASLTGDTTSIVPLTQAFQISTLAGANTTFEGVISGGYGVTITGQGTQNLSGANTFTGDTTLSGGTLVLNGSLAGGLTSAAGSTLKGHGTIAGPADIAGTLSPGNSIGTMYFASLTLESTSNTNIEVDPNSTSLVAVTGAAVLNGSLTVQPDAGTYPKNNSYTILTGGSVTGQFAPVIYPNGFIASVQYNPSSVVLVWDSLQIQTSSVQGRNNLAFANYLNANFQSPATQLFLLALYPLSNSDVNQALMASSPVRNTFSTYSSQITMFTFTELLESRISNQRIMNMMHTQSQPVAAVDEDEWSIMTVANREESPRGSAQTAAHKQDHFCFWVDGFGEILQHGIQNHTYSFHTYMGGALLGLDYYANENGLVGGSVGYGLNSIHDGQNAGNGWTNQYVASLYGTGFFNNAFVAGALWGVFDQFKNERNIDFPGYSATARSSHTGAQVVPHLSGGYDYDASWSVVEPYASLDWVVNFEHSFKEHGAPGMNMHQTGRTSSMLRSAAGLNFYQTFTGDSWDLIVKEGASYVNLAPFQTGRITTALVGVGNSFTSEVFSTVQNLFFPTLELFFRASNNAFVSVTYAGEFGSSYANNELFLKAGLFF